MNDQGEPPFDQDASVCSHDFFVRCSSPNDAWYQCVKCHGSVSETSKRSVDQMPACQDEFRLSIAKALGHTHPSVMSDSDILNALLELRANASEDDRQLAVSRADCSRMYEQRAAARAECLDRTEERDVARADCERMRDVIRTLIAKLEKSLQNMERDL